MPATHCSHSHGSLRRRPRARPRPSARRGIDDSPWPSKRLKPAHETTSTRCRRKSTRSVRRPRARCARSSTVCASASTRLERAAAAGAAAPPPAPAPKPKPKPNSRSRLRRRRRPRRQPRRQQRRRQNPRRRGPGPRRRTRRQGAEEAIEGRRRRRRQGHGRLDDVLRRLRAARRRQGEQQARVITCVGDLRRVGQDVAKTLPVGSRVEATVLSVDATKGFRVALSTKRQRKTAPKPIFEEEKAPVAEGP